MRRRLVPQGRQLGVLLALAVAAGTVGWPISSAWGVATNGGFDIGQYVGAETFYDAGYTGTSAIVVNIEAGFTWNGHVTLTHVTTQLAHGSITGEYDKHATWVGQAIGGRGAGAQERGIAYDATLWTGAIATSWVNPGAGNYATSFNITMNSFAYPYVAALITGVSGQTADVINSSWTDSSGVNGNDAQALAIDGLAWQSGKLIVFAAGNGGPTTNTVNSPGSGTNALVVGGTRWSSSDPPYSHIAPFSSRSPSDFFVPSNASGSSGTTQTGVRARVELMGPASNFRLAYYGGATGGNSFGGPTSSSTTSYIGSLQGTSFAAPTVAGGAALLVDVGKTLYAGNPKATDGRVLKAVMMNSADKLENWDNGQQDVSGVVTTTQSLDYTQGAGRVNLDAAFSQYTTGTADVPGTDGGDVEGIGWDFGRINNGAGVSVQDYPISILLAGGETFTTTLNWYSHEVFNTVTNATSYGAFDNLDLQIWQTTGGIPTTLVAESESLYNSSEHLHFTLPDDGFYLIRVLEDNFTFNFAGDTGTDYGLAWDAPRLWILGDTDGDGDVDVNDLVNVKTWYGEPGPGSTGDADGDGDSDIDDLVAVKNNFGYVWAPGLQPEWTFDNRMIYNPVEVSEGTTQNNITPEPASAALMLLAGAMGLARRGRFTR